MEVAGGFTFRFTSLVGFQRPLDDVGDRTIFPPRQAMREISRLRAPDRKLGLRHASILSLRQAAIRSPAMVIKAASEGL